MEKVSGNWKGNQSRTIANESFIEISLGIADPEALADASATDNGALYFSNTSQVVSEVDRNIPPYATLEQNLWVLDGGRKVLPVSNVGDTGFISNAFCDDYGVFNPSPMVTVNFTRVHTNPIPAITIVWGEVYSEYAEDFTVKVYKENKVVAEQTVRGNKSVKSVVRMDIDEYDKVTIAVNKWCLPRHRARISDIYVGLKKVYSKADIFSYNHTQTVDPVSTSLPKAEVSFSVDNSDATYDLFNKEGLAEYIMERQEVKTRYGYKLNDGVEWIRGGTFYLSEWGNTQNNSQTEFKARDMLEFMSALVYDGMFNANGVSLYSLAEKLFEKANLPLSGDGTVKWVIDESLKNIYTTAPLPIDTIANCLQLIANAGGCVFYQDRGGKLHIEPFNGEVHEDYTINNTNSYSKPEITLSKPLKQVNISAYHYFEEEDVSELYKGSLTLSKTSEMWITYSDRAVEVSAVAENGTIESAEYYTNACKLKIIPNSTEVAVSITVSGKLLKSSKTDVVTQGGAKGEEVSLDNPLITDLGRASIIGAWVMEHLGNRMSISPSWRADPRLDVLDIVRVQLGNDTYDTRLTDVNFTYNGAFRGTAEGKVK